MGQARSARIFDMELSAKLRWFNAMGSWNTASKRLWLKSMDRMDTSEEKAARLTSFSRLWLKSISSRVDIGPNVDPLIPFRRNQ